ncbi:DUF2330 domain-containing protein [Pseudenhygromyxa sp. WMMC2535]|uniref:DUF2330 domain-containing protein n=1 Tax=Pseudenhygromyxa sp. WMMC2535 TaxID=2712867 RepID=UPI001554BEDF|nr:DUF2330 domain-containing protein [Pseudenhygromyxa sp. WMMC2535]NVB36863.1 DUF2330 domain-containing protein [Pseudenhygromyxa sp. WMMC2535]
MKITSKLRPRSRLASRLRSPRAAAAAGASLLGLSLALFAAPSTSAAFCGFYVAGADTKLYNNATMVVMMRDGKRTVLAMQNNYQGPPEDFAMVVPVPVVLSEDDVKVLGREVFERVDQLAAPRLVEYWEQDPCYRPAQKFSRNMGMMRDESMAMAEPEAEAADYGVTIEAEFTVGEYEVVVLGAQDSTGLDTWLRDNGYSIPAGAEPVLRPYVQSGMKFFVAKVDAQKVRFGEDGQAMLSPLRFHYDAESFSLPVRLGLINSQGDQDLLIHILGKGERYEAANYPNVTIPTNLEVKDETRERFGEFFASLFDHTQAENPGAVVTEYAWAASSCDPCPVEPLSGQELRVLGADVLPSMSEYFDEQGHLTGDGAWIIANEFTLTRLHARYDSQSLGEDLVFQAAPAIVGGREFLQDDGVLERGSRPADYGDNFQARYIIRHYWEGPVQCSNPRFGVWGGPPAGVQSSGETEVAKDLAFVERGAALTSFVTAAAQAELGLSSEAPPEKLPHANKRARAESREAAGGGASGGCAHCSTQGSGGWGAGALALLGMFGLTGFIRRRR